MSKVVCSACGGQFRAPENAAGKRYRCPKCGGVISIPATAGLAASAKGAAPSVAPAPAAAGAGRTLVATAARPPLVPPHPAPVAAPAPGRLAPRPAPPPMAPAFVAPLVAPAAARSAAGPVAAPPAKRGGIPLWLILGGAGLAAVVALAVGATVVYLLLFSSPVNQGNFDKVKPGMARADVEGILGKPTQSQDLPFLNINASVWSDKKKAIVVWYQDGNEIHKIITDGRVNVSGPPPDLKAKGFRAGGNPVAALGGEGSDKDPAEKNDSASASGVGPSPEQQRQMDEAFREAMKTFPKDGQPPR